MAKRGSRFRYWTEGSTNDNACCGVERKCRCSTKTDPAGPRRDCTGQVWMDGVAFGRLEYAY